VNRALTHIGPSARVARGATYLLIQGFLNAAIGLVFFIVLAHVLANRVDEMGVYTLLSFILALIPVIGTLALPSAAIKYISKYLAEDDKTKAREVVVRVLQIGSLASVGAFVILFIPAEPLSKIIFGISDYALLLRVLAFCSIFTILNTMTSSFLQGLQKIGHVAALGLGYTIIQATLGIVLLLLGWGLYAVVLGWLTGLIVISVVGLLLTARYVGFLGKLHPSKPLLSYSLPLYVSNSISFFVGWVDQLLLVAILGQETLGVYSVAVRAAAIPALFSTSIVVALFPKLSELYTKQGSQSLEDAFKVSTRYSVLVGFPLIVGLAALSYPMVILFGGVPYIGAVEPLIILCIAALANALGVAVSSIFLTLGRTKIVSVLSIVSVGLNMLLSYTALVPLNLGMVGTATARTFGAIITLALNIYVLSRYMQVSFDKEAFWKASLACLVLVIAVFALDGARMLFVFGYFRLDQFLVLRLLLLPVYIVIACLAYFVALIGLRTIKAQDVELAKQFLPRSLNRIAGWLERIAADK
jgi:O-antigen/teichoic acid export membrane protein